jgi:hypothetical protein
MILNRGEFFAKLGELLDDSDVRFSFAGEEMEVENIEIEADMDQAWIILIPLAETEEETGPWFVGRHERSTYIAKHDKKEGK